ncbi:MAG: CAF17-like 4Fe-4S cluster assembly/insertion protein YgfZ [Actinomycetota bacterium]
MDRDAMQKQVGALDEGRGALDLDGFRVIEVTGPDAAAWLQDLVTANVEALEPGEEVRSLLLEPTGRIRADLHVLGAPEGFLLVQPLDQRVSVADLLAPYVLSSDVAMREAPPPGLVAIPRPGSWRFVPPGDDLVPVRAEAVEAWRIRRGLARFPIDLDEDSLPAEAGLDDEVTIDRTKGCYLGQESVAKVRNLGHPARVIVSLRADGPLETGQAVLAGEVEAGLLTSVDTSGDGVATLARVRWDAREADLRTAGGIALRRR